MKKKIIVYLLIINAKLTNYFKQDKIQLFQTKFL